MMHTDYFSVRSDALHRQCVPRAHIEALIASRVGATPHGQEFVLATQTGTLWLTPAHASAEGSYAICGTPPSEFVNLIEVRCSARAAPVEFVTASLAPLCAALCWELVDQDGALLIAGALSHSR